MAAKHDNSTTGRRKVAGSGDRSVGPTRRPGLAIVGMSVPDIVAAVGGWSVDCSLAGWQVDAYTPGEEDLTALRIVGATPAPLDALLGSRARPDGVTAMVVSVDIFRRHPELWERASGWLANHLSELAVWGDPLPLNMIERLRHIDRPISAAAAAFKTLAVEASGTAAPVTAIESFRSAWNHRVGSRRLRARLG